jgi:hypothetical protein
MVFSHGGYGKAEATTVGRAYAFPGFRPEGTVRGIFGDPKARIIKLNRRSKNAVRRLRRPAQRLVRSYGPACTQSVLRGHARIP